MAFRIIKILSLRPLMENVTEYRLIVQRGDRVRVCTAVREGPDGRTEAVEERDLDEEIARLEGRAG